MNPPLADDRAGPGAQLRNLRTFVVAVRAGSMSRAAAELGISQPTVSGHIGELERAVGKLLLDRKQDGVALTPVGERLLLRATEALDLLDAAVREATFVADPGAGEVRIGASEPYIASGFLAAAIDRAQQHHPQLEITVVPADTGALDFGGLRERKLDVVLGRMPAEDACADIEAEVLFREPILVATGVQSRWARAQVGALRDLTGARWLLGPHGTAVRALVTEAFRAEGLPAPRGAVNTHSMLLRLQLLARCDYVSSMPSSLLRLKGREWGLTALPITLRQSLPVVVATLRRRSLAAPVHLFLGHLRAVTAELNGEEDGPAA
ncbi:LysR family transcriptional regulator [Roseicella aquatilis]|uniref:LysR family transcriptional regulator n=1 Tax=Roseicella aquatilis TaxID=2527868 RepID=A0A4R4DM15_9PROT|nr:LysR family transcriptional regulator [Roseicella aquatilis]TCZ61123.1 LysR family transcriptional regulator [Roseicella aquatilis]